METKHTPGNWENELQALRNALDYHNLIGYKVHQWIETDKRRSTGKYFLTDEKGISLTGSWDYVRLNHFIMGYGKAFNKLKATAEPDMLETLEDAREVLLYYMDAPEWSNEHDEVYNKVVAAINKANN